MAAIQLCRSQFVCLVSRWSRLRLAGAVVADARLRLSSTACLTTTAMCVLPCNTCRLRADGVTGALVLHVRHYAKKKGKPSLFPAPWRMSGIPTSIATLESGVVDMAELSSSMERAVDALKWEFTYRIIEQLTPEILDQLEVMHQGRHVPLEQLGQVTMPNEQTILIDLTSQPETTDAVVKAIKNLGHGLNPIPEDKVVRVPIPKMSKETRRELIKLAKGAVEILKINIRRAQQKGISEARKAKGDVTLGDIRRTEKQIQTLTEEYTKKLEMLLDAKKKELLGT